MGLVPRAAKPKTILRRTAVKRGGKGGSVVWQALAVYFVGGASMLRTRAVRGGLFGANRMWQVILLGVVLRNQLSREPEPIAIEKLKPGQWLTVRVEQPRSRKERKRTGLTRKLLEERALADVAAARGVDSVT